MYIKMESPKYLIIITLIDGQNFTVPDGALDKIEASVFAEARFGNESILKSDPIKLTNSNPEFVTELAWQLDKKSLHQLRVERKSIKLQIFMQTKERVKGIRQQNNTHLTKATNGLQTNDSSSNNKVELIGYTIIDIRSAQDREPPKYQWLPLLNPKFRKPLYNRPEIQLAVTLSRINENIDDQASPSTSSCTKTDLRKKLIECSDWQSSSHESEQESLTDDKLYRTCLDFTINSDQVERDEIIENDINIISKDELFFMFDKRNPEKSTIEDCDERYKITVTIPFTSNLETLVKPAKGDYYFSVSFLGSIKRTNFFDELTSVETKEVEFEVCTTHLSILTTYFRLNSNLDIKLHKNSGESIGVATIQLDQLCSFDTKRRSIEGIFALQSMQDHDIPSAIHPSVGVSVVIEKISTDYTVEPEAVLVSDKHIELAKEHFGDEIDDYLYKTLNDTHQLTLEASDGEHQISNLNAKHKLVIDDVKEDDHHFCFTIDLKNFSYNQNQRLIPTLRELLVRYSYPFFGYKDTITTDASIPISPTTSIIVSGFCEFNFATTKESLLNALREIPLDLEILTCEHSKRVDFVENHEESVVAMCNLNLAQALGFSQDYCNHFPEDLSTTMAAPIYALDGEEIGELQIFLGLKDLGKPSFDFKASVENIDNVVIDSNSKPQSSQPQIAESASAKIDAFILETKNNLESWKENYCDKFVDEIRKRESERYKRLLQRFEAKEAKREQEFRKKIDELSSLEKRYKNSLSYIETLERKLSYSFDQLKTKDAILDSRLDTLDLKISKAINNIKTEYEKRLESLPVRRYSDETRAETKNFNRFVSSKPSSDVTRRSSLRSSDNNAGIPVPIRSTSLVRNATEGSTTRLVKRPTNVVTTVVNGTSLRPLSNSTRHTLSKETQEKLANLRKEKAELLKRGCRPNDELIQEINSLIEKLAC